MAEDYDRDIDGTQDRKLVGLLEKAAFSLEERTKLTLAFDHAQRWGRVSDIHRTVAIILDGSDFNFPPTHGCLLFQRMRWKREWPKIQGCLVWAWSLHKNWFQQLRV